MLMKQLDFNLLFRWFVGLNMDDPIGTVTVFTKNRERLLEGDVAEAHLDHAHYQGGSDPCPRPDICLVLVGDRSAVEISISRRHYV